MKIIFLYVLITLLLGFGAAVAAPPFSGPDDVKFAKKLWNALESNRLVGANRFQSMPYRTPPPHGHFVEALDGEINVDGREALVIVKKNFGKTKEETRQQIADNPMST